MAGLHAGGHNGCGFYSRKKCRFSSSSLRVWYL